MSTLLQSLTSRTLGLQKRSATSTRWGGYVHMVDPGTSLTDPFIFFVHHIHSFNPGERAGFPPHPHRGFETVTYIIDGEFDHGDSKGNKGRYGNGDVQWLTTGKGVLHSEMFVIDPKKKTHFNGFQLWLNLPKHLKMSEPGYQMLWAKDIPIAEVPTLAYDKQLSDEEKNSKVKVKIIAGEYGGKKADIEKSTPVSYFHIYMPPKSRAVFPVPIGHNCIIYPLMGTASYGPDHKQSELSFGHYSLLSDDGNSIDVRNPSNENVEFLLLEGKPFKEPIAHQGPFVMNTRDELIQAFNDYRMGLFGEMDEDDY